MYCGGHGASQAEKQVFLLNGDRERDVLYNVEQHLRYFVKHDQERQLHIFAIYDCCRVMLQNMPGLDKRGAVIEKIFDTEKRGVGDESIDDY